MKKKIFRILLVVMAFMAITPAGAQTRKGVVRKGTVRKSAPARKPAVTAKPTLIDLGLPSGNLWADRNVGAATTTNFGGYFAFGETKTKTTYLQSNHTAPDVSDVAGTKYDVATVKYGKGWQVPTEEDWQELFDNCQNDCIYQNGVTYMKFTGPNGNYIIIPFAKNNVFWMFKDYAYSKQWINGLAVVKNLDAGLEPYITAGLDAHYGLAFYTCSSGKFAFMIGITYSAQGQTSTRGSNQFKIQSGGDGGDSFGVPVRAVYHKAASASEGDDSTNDDGTIDMGDN